MTSPDNDTICVGTLINNTWKLTRKLGAGAFGEIYLASCFTANGLMEVAVKFEKNDTTKKQLHIETYALVKVQGF